MGCDCVVYSSTNHNDNIEVVYNEQGSKFQELIEILFQKQINGQLLKREGEKNE